MSAQGEPDVAARDLGTLEEIAKRLSGRVTGEGTVRIAGVASVDDARPGTLTFATDARYLRIALASKASAVLTDEKAVADAPDAAGKPMLVVAEARRALVDLLRLYEPVRATGTQIHPSAAIDPSAQLGPDAVVGPHASVGARARIGARVTIGAGCVVGDDAVLGDDVVMAPRAMFLDRCIAGNRVVLQAGAVIGSDGFGYVFAEGRFVKIPQVGTVVLGDDVEIGANTCVDRAQTGATRIGEGTKIDNLVQIGHNCHIGKNAAFAALTGMAGSTIVGDYTRAGGMVGFRGHITVGSRVTIAGNAKIWGDVPDDVFISGDPAQPHRAELRWQASLRKVPKLLERVDALERKS